MRDEKAKLRELSNNISDRSEAKGTSIMSDLLLGMAKPDTSGKSALYYIITVADKFWTWKVEYELSRILHFGFFMFQETSIWAIIFWLASLFRKSTVVESNEDNLTCLGKFSSER